MPKIYFIRHGETDWNADNRLQGQIDIPLNDKGRSQARRNGLVLADLITGPEQFDFVASPLGRTIETMQIVRRSMGLAPDEFRTDDRLKEVAFGTWEGRRWEELRETEPDNVAQYLEAPWDFAPPEGEGYGGAAKRAVGWLESVVGDTIVVSHGGISRCLRGHILKLPKPDIVHLKVPHDRILLIEGDQINWH